MQYLPGDLAQLEVDDEANRRRQAQAQALQQAGFNPVQGGNSLLSLLTSVMSTVQGGRMMSESDAKASEILAKKFELQNAEDQAKAEQEAAREEKKWKRELEKIDYGNKSAAQYREPGNIDPNSPAGIAARLQFEQGRAGMQPKAAGPAAPAWQKQLDAAKAMGIELSPEDLKQLVTGLKPAAAADGPKALGAEAAAKVALYENAMRDAKAYQKAVINPDGSFNDTAANMPANVRLRESALRAKLRAESGASISPDEASAENDRYGPKLLSSDATNAAAANRLIEDLQHQSTTIRGGSPEAPQAPQIPGAEETKVINGQTFVKIAGQWMQQ